MKISAIFSHSCIPDKKFAYRGISKKKVFGKYLAKAILEDIRGQYYKTSLITKFCDNPCNKLVCLSHFSGTSNVWMGA
jgi:hypothetical protein